MDEQGRRFWHHASAVAAKILQNLGINRLIVAGPPDATAAVANRLKRAPALQVVAIVPVPPHARLTELKDLTLQAALAEEHRREQDLVRALVERTGTRAAAVVGPTAVLDALTKGRAQHVIVDIEQVRTPLLRVLPLLVRRYGADLEMVSGEAAQLLEPHGGIGAILRYVPVPAG